MADYSEQEELESAYPPSNKEEYTEWQADYHGSPSIAGRVIKLESKVGKLQTMQYANLGATAVCIGGLFMGARVVAKLIKATNGIVQALDQAATGTIPGTMVPPPSTRRAPEDIGAMREGVDTSPYQRSTTGHDPGPQEVPDDVKEALSRDSNLDSLFNSDDI
jgi:hypothetical protein